GRQPRPRVGLDGWRTSLPVAPGPAPKRQTAHNTVRQQEHPWSIGTPTPEWEVCEDVCHESPFSGSTLKSPAYTDNVSPSPPSASVCPIPLRSSQHRRPPAGEWT